MKPFQFPAIRPIAERAGQIRMFNLLLQESLPNHLVGRVQVLNLRADTLILGVDHGSLATQARFQSGQWLNQINLAAQAHPRLPKLAGIEIRINVEPPLKKLRRPGLPPDAETRQALLNLASSEPDPKLAEAMRRLAQVRNQRRRTTVPADESSERSTRSDEA